MRTDWQSHLDRWAAEGLVEPALAERIREWEAGQARPTGLRWPIVLALASGALLLGAGVLLFVSAHWDELSPGQRFSLVLALLAVFHAGGAAAAQRFENLSIALHTLGTVALGAAIALTGQIFHLQEHWPAAVLMWAAGALAAWILTQHWTQGALLAILAPYWLSSEWYVRMAEMRTDYMTPVAAGICALSLTYLSARNGPDDTPLRKALAWLGGIALLPAAIFAAVAGTEQWSGSFPIPWSIAGLAPLAVAIALRGPRAWWNAAAILWSLLLPLMTYGPGDHLAVYAWCALGAIGLAWWGVQESRAERIDLGIAGLAITVLFFYFASVMDKLGRSASLITLGLLFLGGGWLLERTRRRLVAQIRPEVL